MYKKKTYHNLKHSDTSPGSILNFKVFFPTVILQILEEQLKKWASLSFQKWSEEKVSY